jgi:twinkle protein
MVLETEGIRSVQNIETSLQWITYRGINAATATRYNVKTEVTSDGTPVKRRYPYPWGGIKIRTLKDFTYKKDSDTFHSEGNMRRRGLFGRDLFDPGAARIITIVEGEEDAPSAWQMLSGRYPVVSVQSGSTAKDDCIADRDWLNLYDKIYLALDNDDVGRKATKEIAGLFDYNKIFLVRLTQFKDANDYLRNGKQDDFCNIWYNAKRYSPEGIVSSWDDFRIILKKKEDQTLGSYPFEQIQNMARGFRAGEVVLIDAQEGIGKTEFVRALEFHILRTTNHNIGCIHLEESQERQLLGLAGLQANQPLHLAEGLINEGKVFEHLKSLTGRDDRLYLYKHFGSDDPSVILDTIRYMVSARNCRIVFLDHITMVVTGLHSDDERKTLDYLSTRLAMMVEEHQFCLVMVSHVNDDNKTRGSRNIAKVADLRISLERNIEAENDDVRNTTRLMVRKNRFGSITGPGGDLLFDPKTFTLIDKAKRIKLPNIADGGE